MTGPLVRRSLTLLAVVLLAALIATPARACPFCGMSGQTLTQEMEQAAFVIYGTMKNPRLGDANGEAGFNKGQTDLVLDKDSGIIKDHAFLAGKKVVTIPKYVDERDPEKRWLVFCDFFRGNLDPYRGMPVGAKSDMGKYLKGAMAVRTLKAPERLKLFFNYLQNEDVEIANDALKEFGNSTYDEYRGMAAELPADTVAGWLKDKNTPTYRVGLYASILGHASKKPDEHGKLLRSLVEDPETRVASGVDGVLAGMVLLQPKEGWAYLKAVLGNKKHDFNFRYSTLKAARFFIDNRADVIARNDVIETIAQLLEQGDIADLSIEDMRRWKAWDYTAQVLSLKDRSSHDLPIMRRAILRFMLSSPQAEAKQYVEQVRKEDPDLVESAEEVLKAQQALEQPQPGGSGK